MEAGFAVSASWPINTEAEGSLHIKDKAAANSTIFLVCRSRMAAQDDAGDYWEDIEPLVTRAARARVAEFQQAGITGVDLYLASFGPALEEFSRLGRSSAERLDKNRKRRAGKSKPSYSRQNGTRMPSLPRTRWTLRVRR
jgi:putative DNA methylase